MHLPALGVKVSQFRSRRAELQFLAGQAPQRVCLLHGTHLCAAIYRFRNSWGGFFLARACASSPHSIAEVGLQTLQWFVVAGASAKDLPGQPMAQGLDAMSTTAGVFTASTNTSWPRGASGRLSATAMIQSHYALLRQSTNMHALGPPEPPG